MTVTLPESEFSRLTVLIADDNKVMRSMLREVLADAGLHVVAEAATGKEALSQYRKLKPKMVCLDMQMPEMNGVEVLIEIRNENPNVILLLITGDSTSDVVYRAKSAGVSGVIAKPFSPKTITDEIRRCGRLIGKAGPTGFPG